MNWTIEKVKNELPDIKINHHGKIIKGQIKGRKLKFPIVYYLRHNNLPFHDGHEIMVSWETVVDVLNHDRAIQI